MFVSGNVNSGSTAFAQFDARIAYTWTDVNSDGTLGSTTNLGTLSYSFLQIGGGSFVTPLTSSGVLASSPSSAGILEISGYMWLAGDPFDVTVTVAPEPTSLGLTILAAAGLLCRRRSSRGTRGLRSLCS